MREFFRSTDGVAISALQSDLESAGIASHLTHETGDVYGIATDIVLWIDEDADLKTVEQIWLEFQQRSTREKAERATRVCVADDATLCNRCDYDLRGQTADGKCPECGHPYRLILAKPCPACGAQVPLDFELCWKCGGVTTESEPPPDSQVETREN